MSSKSERTIKVIVVSVPGIKGYSRHEVRVVECNADQAGYDSNRGVKVWYRSEPLYRVRTKSGRGKGPETVAYAKAFAERKLRKVLGV